MQEIPGWAHSMPGWEGQAQGQSRLTRGGAESTSPPEHPLVTFQAPWVYGLSFLRTG